MDYIATDDEGFDSFQNNFIADIRYKGIWYKGIRK